eukprot:Pgem_evm1s1420
MFKIYSLLLFVATATATATVTTATEIEETTTTETATITTYMNIDNTEDDDDINIDPTQYQIDLFSNECEENSEPIKSFTAFIDDCTLSEYPAQNKRKPTRKYQKPKMLKMYTQVKETLDDNQNSIIEVSIYKDDKCEILTSYPVKSYYLESCRKAKLPPQMKFSKPYYYKVTKLETLA